MLLCFIGKNCRSSEGHLLLFYEFLMWNRVFITEPYLVPDPGDYGNLRIRMYGKDSIRIVWKRTV